MEKYVLEGCVDSVESALAATKGGANRLELCSNLVIGGTTPTLALYQMVREHCENRIHVLIRPRFGDFLYSDLEFEQIIKEVEMFRDAGADGVVVGCLMPDGTLNAKRMKCLREKAGSMWVTLHRAFDMCINPLETMEIAIELGYNSILSSGCANTCMEGRKLLKKMSFQSDGRIEILAGSGINAETIKELASVIKIPAFHMSGKGIEKSGMKYRKESVHMGIPSFSEYERFVALEEEFEKAACMIQKCYF